MKQSSCLRVVDGLLDINQMIYKRKYITLDLIKISQRFGKNTMEDVEIDKIRIKVDA